jgi:hypothetical protein
MESMGKSRGTSCRGRYLGAMLGALLLAAPGMAFAGVVPHVNRIHNDVNAIAAAHMRVPAASVPAGARVDIDPRLERGTVPGTDVSGGGAPLSIVRVS